MTQEEVQKSVHATLAYFAVMRYPVTTIELWQWLWVESGESCTLFEVTTALDALVAVGAVGEHNGHYALHNVGHAYEERQQRMILAQKKFVRAQQFVRVLRCFPFVRAIAVVNTLALDYSRKEADIDLLVVAEDRRLWTVRFFIIFFLKLLGVRPRPEDEEDAICVSYFLSEKALDISCVNYQDDIHNYYWTATVYPIFATGLRDKGLGVRWLEKNAWVKNKLPHSSPLITHASRQVRETYVAIFVRKILELPLRFFGAVGERLLQRLQLRMMPERLRTLEHEDNTDVIFNEQMLKFHTNDRRKWWREEWKNNAKKT